MYPTSTPTTGLDSLLGVFVAGGLIYLLFVFALFFIGAYISYRIIRAAVRDGVVLAIKKTGLDSGSPTMINGYPPAQAYGAPPAPVTEYQGYGRPGA